MEFSKWWVTEFKHIKFPSQGTIFDYFLDHETKKWLPWREKVSKFVLDPEMPLQVCRLEKKLLKKHMPFSRDMRLIDFYAVHASQKT